MLEYLDKPRSQCSNYICYLYAIRGYIGYAGAVRKFAMQLQSRQDFPKLSKKVRPKAFTLLPKNRCHLVQPCAVCCHLLSHAGISDYAVLD